ncbi:MAG: alpha/beta fold hydrolase [Candidatus Kryptoniota bacterium]
MRLNYITFGDGPSLVILHGLFGSLDNWYSLSKAFAEGFRVITVDMRNHGRSPHSFIFNYQVMAKDILELLDDLRISEASLLGHSLGGKVAMQFVSLYPNRVHSLVVVDIAPRSYEANHLEIIQSMLSLHLSSHQTRKELDAELAQSIREYSVRQLLLKNVGRDSSGKFFWKFGLEEIAKNYDEVNREIRFLSKINKPTLFIRGGKSNYINDENILDIKKYFSKVEIVTIPAAGHWVHADAPAEFLRIVMDFLERN